MSGVKKDRAKTKTVGELSAKATKLRTNVVRLEEKLEDSEAHVKEYAVHYLISFDILGTVANIVFSSLLVENRELTKQVEKFEKASPLATDLQNEIASLEEQLRGRNMLRKL